MGKTSTGFCAYPGLLQRPNQVVFLCQESGGRGISLKKVESECQRKEGDKSWDKRAGDLEQDGERRAHRRFRPTAVTTENGNGRGLLLGGVGSAVHGRPGRGRGVWAWTLAFRSPSSPLPACSLRPRLNTHALSCFPILLSAFAPSACSAGSSSVQCFLCYCSPRKVKDGLLCVPRTPSTDLITAAITLL